MSQRQSVDRARIRLFLERLAARYRGAARIYLVGGTTLVYEGLRQQSLDIDLVLEVAREQHSRLVQAIRELKDELSLNVEEASPGDFIPLPSGHEGRHAFVERFGQIDVYHFDLYSTALSKVERGRTQDFEDVLTLLTSGRIQWDRLEACFREILPLMGRHSLRQDPAELEANFRTLEQMRSRGGGA